MADFGTPVATSINVNPQQGIQTLSGLLGLKQQQLGIQTAQAGVQTAQAEAQQQQQTAQQRSNLASWYADNLGTPATVGTDGTIDLNKTLTGQTGQSLMQAAGDFAPDAIQHLVSIKQAQLGAVQTQANMDASARTQLQQQLGGLRDDPDVLAGNQQGANKISQTFSNFAEQNPEDQKIAQIYGGVLAKINPSKWVQTISNMQLQSEAASSQAAAQSPSLFQSGGTAVNVAPQSAGGPLRGINSIKMTIPPGFTQGTDQYGNPIYYSQQNPGVVYRLGANGRAPSVGNQGQPSGSQGQSTGSNLQPANGVYQMPYFTAGESTNIPAQGLTDQKVYSSDVATGAQAPGLKNALNSIRTLSTQVPTGTGSQYLSNAETVLGQYIPGLSGAASDAAKRQMIGKYYEQVAMQLTTNNFGTDAARGMVGHALPNPDNMTPQALQDASRYISTQEMIAQALGKFATQYQTQNHSSVGYQNARSQFIMNNVDPRIFDFMQAHGTQSQAQWLKSTFGNNRAAAFQFGQKLNRLEQLSGFNYGSQ